MNKNLLLALAAHFDKGMNMAVDEGVLSCFNENGELLPLTLKNSCWYSVATALSLGAFASAEEYLSHVANAIDTEVHYYDAMSRLLASFPLPGSNKPVTVTLTQQELEMIQIAIDFQLNHVDLKPDTDLPEADGWYQAEVDMLAAAADAISQVSK